MSLHSLATGADLHVDKLFKTPARAVSTNNITITSPGATIDGVTLVAGDRVLLTAETSSADNGIYVWHTATSSLTRASDAGGNVDFPLGFLIFVSEGTTNGRTIWVFTTSGAVAVGSTGLTFTNLSAIGPTGATGPTGSTGPAGPSGAAGSFIVSGEPPYILIQDQKTQSTQGGTFTSGADRTRDLNTIVVDTAGLAVLASNQFTLPAGTYRIAARLPARQVAQHQSLLFNVTAAATVFRGSSAYAAASGDVQTDSILSGRFSIASTSTFEIRHRGQTTVATNGFGVPAQFSTEVYASVELWMVGGPAIPPGTHTTMFDLPPRARPRLIDPVVRFYANNNILPV